MNYLGHLYLSPTDAAFRLGNLMADGLPAKEAAHYPLVMQLGYRFHHWIDDFTDHHPAFRHCRELLAASQRHYAGVVVDMLFDHFLAKNWAEYSSQSLADFAQDFYTQYTTFRGHLPAHFMYMMRYMIRYRWLESYASMEGLQRALTGLSRRASFQNNMHAVPGVISAFEKELEEGFRTLMNDIRPEASLWIAQHQAQIKDVNSAR